MPESQSQVKMAGAVMSGKSHAMPKSVAREMLTKMRGHKMSELPKHARLKAKLAKRRNRG